LRPTSGATLHRDAAARPGETDATETAAKAASAEDLAPNESKD
jgi:hypothetical protein